VTQWGTWADDGAFTVTAIVSDDDGATTAYALSVTIANAAPAVEFALGPGSPIEGRDLLIQVNVTDAGPWDIVNVSVDYGDGSPTESIEVRDWRTHQNALFVHAFRDEGVFTVRITADDGDGGAAEVDFTVEVLNAAPEVAFDEGPPQTLPEGSWVNVTPVVTDPGRGDVVAVAWALDGAAVLPAGPAFSHFFRQEGVYLLQLAAQDNDGARTVVNFTVTVLNGAPTIEALVAPEGLLEGARGAFSVLASDPGPDDVLTVTWEWDDGSISTGTTVHKSFDSPSGRRATVTVRDERGEADARAFTFSVLNAVPEVRGVSAGNLAEGALSLFFAEVANPAGEALVYLWSFGDGSTSAEPQPTHTFVDDGDFTVTLRVVEPEGEAVTLARTFSVANAPPSISCPECPARVAEGAYFEINLQAADAGANDTFVFTMEWPGAEPIVQGSPSFRLRIVGPGAVDLVATVDDGDGGTDSLLLHIQVLPDADRDGEYDLADPDDDNDGSPDARDPAPLDPGVRETAAGSWLWLLLVAAGAGLALFLTVRRRRGGGDGFVEVRDPGGDGP
jgi:PKD repeat protein